MFTIAWLFIKTCITEAIPFILRNWKVILIGFICWYAYSQKMAYEASMQELEAFKANIAELAKKQAHQNEIKRVKAESAIKSAQLNHTKQIEDIKNAYAKSNKLNNLTIRDLRNRLRDNIADSFTLPQVDTNTIATADEWRNNYSTLTGQYKTLIDACSITTSDYNLLRGWGDAACLQVGCE